MTVSGRRHVTGLRREEVAERAGIGLSWYTLLEQGRARGVTDRALHRIADALQLTPLERAHVLALARARDADPAGLDVPAELVEYVSSIASDIAFLTAPQGTVVAWNDEANLVFGFSALDAGARNLVVGLVRGGPFREALPEWRDVLDNMIAVMHAHFLDSDDPAFETLIDGLAGEPLFDAAWNARRIEAIPFHVCSVRHPQRGIVRMRLLAFAPAHRPHHTLIVLDAERAGEK